MDIYKETSLRIDFAKGQEIDITVVFDTVEIENKTFHKDEYKIEEVIDFIVYNENGGCDVYL
jgi:hypothetical protein